MHWMQSCAEKLTTGQILYLPVSIQHIVFFFLPPFSSFEEMTERAINCWNPGPLTQTHTHTHTNSDTHTKTQIHHSCFMWGALNSAIWRAQFPWQQVWGLGWKTVIPEQLSEHLDSEEHLRAKGRSRGRGWKWRNLGRLEGSREKRRNG